MTEKTDNLYQDKVEQEFFSFLNRDLKDQLLNLSATFHEPLRLWFTSTRDELLHLKRDENTYQKQIELLNRKLPELKRIIESLRSEGWYEQFTIAIRKAVQGLSDEITVEQSPNLLRSEESDSLTLRSLKFLKRVKSRLQRKTLTRTVYPKKLFLQHLHSNKSWINTFASREYEEYCNLLDYLIDKNEQIEDMQGTEESEIKSETDFKSQVILNLEESLQEAVQHCKKLESDREDFIRQTLKSISKEITDKCKIAGTYQYSQNKEDKDGISLTNFYSQNTFTDNENEWIKYLLSQVNDLKVNAEIARYGLKASNGKEQIKNHIHNFFRDTFYVPATEAIEATKSTHKSISEISANSGIRKKLVEYRNELNKELLDHILRPLSEIDHGDEPLHEIQKLLSDLQVETRYFSDEIELAVKRDKTELVPTIEIETVRWQTLASRYLKQEMIKNLNPSIQEFDLLISEVINTIEESIQIADVNLEAAIESISGKNGSEPSEEIPTQTPQQISLEGLNRAITILETGIRDIREKHNRYQNLVETLIPTTLHTLSGIMLRREFSRFNLQDKALLVKEQALNWHQKFTSKWAIFSERVELRYRFISRKVKEYSRIVKPYLGIQSLSDVSFKEKRNLIEYLAISSAQKDIPFVYKRLFDLDFTIDQRFYIPPRNGMVQFESSLEQWKKGMATNICVVGEKGSGKTTFFHFTEVKYLENVKRVKINFNETFTEEIELLSQLCKLLGFKPVKTKEEFLAKVEKKKERTVIIIENLQNIFIRNIEGFEALRAFWVIMSSSSDKLFWMVSCSRYAWEFFIKINDADQYFSHIVYTDRLEESDIQSAILERHKSSGYELYFEPDESIRKTRAFKKLLGNKEESQKLVRDQFFTKLSKLCEGNISIGMIFWLRSIKEFDDQRFVFQPIEVTDIDKLEVPSKDVLFTLAALVQHDILNRYQVSLARDEGISDSSLMLARLKTKGIILEAENGYKLNHLLYRQIVRMLKQKNIIH